MVNGEGSMKMLPGVGVFGTGSSARVLVPLLRAEGFTVQALWGRPRRRPSSSLRR